METFKDNQGKAWNIALTLGKVRTLREKLGLDLLEQTHHIQVLGSLTDRIAFVFLLVEDQATEEGVDADAFEERLYGGDYATQASLAFLDELESFFQKLGLTVQARLTRTSIESMKKGQARLADLLESGRVDSILKEAETEIEAMVSDGNTSQS